MYIPTPGLEIALQQWWSRWVLRGRKARPEYLMDGTLLLRYTFRYRASAAVTFALFTGVYVLGYVDGTVFRTDSFKGMALLAGSVLIWLLFAFFFVSSQIERVAITPTQLRRRSWRGRQEVVWGDVRSVRLDHHAAELKIGVEGGAVIDVSWYLDGLGALLDELQRHLRLQPGFFAAVLRREPTGAA